MIFEFKFLNLNLQRSSGGSCGLTTMAHTVGTKDNFVPWLAKLGYCSLCMRAPGLNYQSAALWHIPTIF